MIRKVCDRCGKNIPIQVSTSCAKFPIIEIVERLSIGDTVKIDLCNDCTEQFNDWIISKIKDKNVD